MISNRSYSHVRIIYILTTLFLVGLSLYAYVEIRNLIASSDLVNHTNQVTLTLEKVSNAVNSAETNQRGFLLTGDSLLLAKRDEALINVSRELNQIDNLTAGNPEQQDNLQTLHGSIDSKLKSMHKVIAGYVPLKMSPQFKTNIAEGIRKMGKVQQDIQKMSLGEKELMEQRIKKYTHLSFITPLFIVLLFLSALLILLISYFRINNALHLAQRLQREVLNQNVQIEKNKELQNIFRQSPVSMMLVRGEEFVVDVINENALELWGKKYEEVINQPFFQISPELAEANLPVFNQVYKNGIPFSVSEIPLQFIRNGKQYSGYFNLSHQPIIDNEGKVTAIVSITTEVTDSVVARKEVEESEKRYNLMLLKSPFAFAIQKGDDMSVTFANETIKNIWGKGDDVEGKTMLELLPELKDQPFLGMMQKVYKTGVAQYSNESVAYIMKNGKLEQFYYNIVYQPYYEADGTISGTATIAYDVTKEVAIKQKINESEKQYRELADTLPQLVWKTDSKGMQVFASVRWKEFTGLDPRDPDTFHKIVHPDDLEGIMNVWANSIATGNTYKYEVRLRSKSGDYHWFHNHGEAIKNENGEIKNWIGAFTDINEQKIVEAQLKDSEQRFSSMADNIPILTWMARADGWIYFYNRQWYNYTGTTPQQMEGWGWQSVHHPEWLPKVMEKWQTAIAKGEEFDMVFPLKAADGSFHPFLTRVLPVKDSKGVVQQWFGSNTDITEQTSFAEQLEEKVNERTKELKQSEEKFNKLFAASPLGLTLSNVSDGRYLDVNDVLLKMAGYTREEYIGHTSVELNLVSKEDRDRILDKLKQYGEVKNVEVEMRRKSGEKLPVLNSIETIVIGDKKYFLSAMIDITERKKTEQQIEQKNIVLENMNKELQSFAYISSHDLQEPLRKIQTFASQIMDQEQVGLSDNGKAILTRIQSAAHRMQTLINDLLTYSRTTSEDRKFEKTDLNIIIAEIKDDFKEEFAQRNATVEVANLCEADIIPFQFRQLMHNLIGNALKFCPPDRQPNILIRCETEKGKYFNAKGLSPDVSYSRITISDNGIGFEQQYSEKIFEVFQRLHGKKAYSGTGIGLSIVKKIVDNHHGVIIAKSEPDKGASFEIFVPVVQNES